MSTGKKSQRRSARSAASVAVDDAVAYDILRSLRRILRKTTERSRQLGREAGLTVPQVLCLRAISKASRGEEMTVAKVANSVQLSTATVSRLLDRLEAAGLVLRQRTSRDRRKVCLTLTTDGRRRLRKIPTPLHEQFLERLTRLRRTEQRAMLDCLEQIVEMMDAKDLEAAPVLTPDVEVKPPTVA